MTDHHVGHLCDKCLVALRLPFRKEQPLNAPDCRDTRRLESGRQETRRERVIREKNERRYHDIYPSLDSLARSARSGCEFCALLRTAVQTIEVATTVKNTLQVEERSFALTMDLHYIHDSGHTDTGVCELFLCVELTAQLEGIKSTTHSAGFDHDG